MMTSYKTIFICLFCFLCNFQLGLAESAYTPPPVERIAPPVEKGKKGQKKGKFKRLKLKKKRKAHSKRIFRGEKTQGGVQILSGIGILFLALMAAGALVFAISDSAIAAEKFLWGGKVAGGKVRQRPFRTDSRVLATGTDYSCLFTCNV